MKKIISIVLLICILCSSFSVLSISAADESEYTQDGIIVDRMGTYLFVTVFTNEDDQILVPMDILSFAGGLYQTSDDPYYIFCDGVQGVGYEKEIQISKDGSSGKSVVYITSNYYVTLISINFSDSYEYNGQLFLPLEELLPFLDADVEILDDGMLHIYPNPVSIFNAIAYDTLEDDTFSSDNVVGGKFIGVAGRLIDSIINLRFDRLDIVMHTGAIKDYNEIYKTLLTDNEIYLAAFDKEVTPFENALNVFNDAFDTNNDFVDFVDDLVDTVWIKQAKYILQAKGFKNYKEFSKELKEMKEWSGLEYSADIAEGIFRILDYSNAYVQQVEDHRDMLYAVYNSNFDFDFARTQAANETALLYGQEFSGQFLSMSSSALREYIVEVGTKAITKELLAPYKVAFDILKFVQPQMKETAKNSANMFYLDGIVSDSSEAVEYYIASKSFNENTLENLRLSMIMALLTSKYAYEIYYDGFLEYGKDGGDVAWKYYKINEWLTQLYLAADSVECNTPEYFNNKKAELTEDIKYLQLGDNNTNTDTPNDSEGLEFALNSDKKSYSVTGIGTCIDTDIVIPSEYNGFPVTNIGKSAFYKCYSIENITIPNSVITIESEAFRDCTSLVNVTIGDSVTSIGYSAFRYCVSLESIVIGKSLTFIDGSSFEYCWSLIKIIFNGTLKEWGAISVGYRWNYLTGEYYVSCADGVCYDSAIPIQGDWSVIGTMNSTLWDVDFPLVETENDLYRSEVLYFEANGEFKLRMDGNWNLNIGKNEQINGDNYSVYSSGYYFIEFYWDGFGRIPAIKIVRCDQDGNPL